MKWFLKRLMTAALTLMLLSIAAIAYASNQQDAFAHIPSELLVSKQIGYTITNEPMVIENERFVVNIPSNVYVPDTLESDIHMVMNTIEKQTGLSFYSDYAKEQGHTKVRFDITKYPTAEFAYCSGGAYGVSLGSGDLVSKNMLEFAMTHELLHTIHWRNTLWGSQVLYEAFSTYEVQRIIEAQAYPLSFDSYFNYASRDFDDIAKNKSVKAQFEISDEDGWQAYLLGFRLMHYIVEKYGMDEFYALGRDGEPGYISNMEAYDILLNRYGEAFFTGYAAWLEQNAAKFDRNDSLVDFSNFKRIDIFPLKAAINYYNLRRFTYQDYIVFDFLSGFDYTDNYLGGEAKGCIKGNVFSEGTAQMRFYDADGNVLETLQLKPNDGKSYNVKGATLVAFVGDGKSISFFPDCDEMLTIP